VGTLLIQQTIEVHFWLLVVLGNIEEYLDRVRLLYKTFIYLSTF